MNDTPAPQVDWLRVLEGWQMRESQYIKRWRDEGIDLGALRTRREDLLRVVLRLADPVPEPQLIGNSGLIACPGAYRTATPASQLQRG
jgi:hypothetical protein